MNKWSEGFLKKLKKEHKRELDIKYRLGDKEHDGDLRDMSLEDTIEEAILENIDQYVFLKKIKEELGGLSEHPDSRQSDRWWPLKRNPRKK